MKRLSAISRLIAIMIIFVLGLTAVGCFPTTNPEPVVDKTALEAEIALEIVEQGDYTLDSFNAYRAKLGAAKRIFDDAAATQEDVDAALAALTEAKAALIIRPIEVFDDTTKTLRLISGDSKEIVLADYFNDNGLSNITYEVKVSNAVLSKTGIVDGKFTITAGEVLEETTVTVFIILSHNGKERVNFALPVVITNDLSPTLVSEEVVKEYDLFDLTNKYEFIVDFAENVDNAGNLELTYTVNGEAIDGTTYAIDLRNNDGVLPSLTFNVTVSYTANGEEGTLSYVYKLSFTDTSAHQVENGSFENGPDGWTLETIVGEAPFGGIHDAATFWGEGYPMNNVGNYFSAYAEGASEGSQGTLASSYFTVKSAYATYMLGGAGNHNVYITIEDREGNVLGLYRNTRFTDFPSGDFSVDERREMIGKTVFLANFVTYKVDLSALEGKEIRFVIHDHASAGWGVVFFDELNTYYPSADLIPENAILAENLLANKEALKAELALEVKEQGDYTLDSFNTYRAKFEAAKGLVNDLAVTQATVDGIVSALTEARQALAIRPVEALDGVNKAFRLTSSDSRELDIASYVNTNGLSNITYEVKTSNELLAVSPVVDGKFTLTAGQVSEATDVTVSMIVYYNGEMKLTVEISVQITNDLEPTLHGGEVVEAYDIFNLNNKTDITVDLSKNVDNVGNLALTYSVNGTVINGSAYTFTFGKYSDVAKDEILNVTVSYVANGEQKALNYTYKLVMTDTTAYRLANGGFEDGLNGWTKVGNIGDVSSATHYWVEEWENNGLGYEFHMDGANMFSAYAPGAAEAAVGTLTSSTFKVGGSGFVTFKLGAMKDGNYVYVDVVDAQSKEILVRYYNGLWAEFTDELKSGCSLIAYKADLSAFAGREVFFRISDNADSGYGLFFADSFITYYENEPEGFNAATPVDYAVSGTIYDIFNGGFEMGGNQGWWNHGEPGMVTGADAFFSGVAYGKEGNFLYSGVEDHGAGNGREGNTGVLTSSVFEIGGNGYITYMLGGGNAFCYVQVIDSTTGEVLARYRQQAREDAVLKTYVADLSTYIGRTVRIQLVDNATYDWGCVSFDNVVTYYTSIPEGIKAIDVKHEIVNGSFEDGLNGWKMEIWEAGIHNTLGWVESAEHDAGWYTKNDGRKDGNNLFTFCRPDGTNCENTRGALISSVFTLKQGTYVSFRFGGAGTRDVHLQLCRADGSVIATFYNEAPGKANTEMYAYFYQFTEETTDCYFKVVDNSVSNYGCFVVDDFRVNLESAPEGFIGAIQ